MAVGRLKSGPERDLVSRYETRFRAMGRALSLDGPRMVELSESPARRDIDRKSEESTAILAAIPDNYRVVIFDETGTTIDSASFASKMGEWRDGGAAGVSFVIGGADGLSETVRARANLALAFGKMTIPHQIVRVLVLEQLYRAATLLAGHPYHRA